VKINDKKEADPRHGLCSWKYSDNCHCTRQGTISPAISEGVGTTSGEGSKAKWFCSWHYDCLVLGHKDDSPDGPDYREWYNRNKNYSAKYGQKQKTEVVWDVGDIWQVKGLLVLGKNSIAWKKAPPELREAAERLSGTWKPPVREMPVLTKQELLDVEAEERLAIQEFS
jgi:hypothetical protein